MGEIVPPAWCEASGLPPTPASPYLAKLRARSAVCIIEGVALVEGGARKERLEFPGGAFQGQPPPDPPQALLLGGRVGGCRLGCGLDGRCEL